MRWLLIALALFLVLINSAYAWEYTQYIYAIPTSLTTNRYGGLTMESDSNCTVYYTIDYLYNYTDTVHVTAKYYQPTDLLRRIGDKSFSNSLETIISDIAYNSYKELNNQFYYSSKTTIETTNYSKSYFWVESKFVCNEPLTILNPLNENNAGINIFGYQTDTFGFRYDITTNNYKHHTFDNFIRNYYGKQKFIWDGVLCVGYWYIPFSSGKSGLVNVSVSFSSTSTTTPFRCGYIYVYNLNDTSKTYILYSKESCVGYVSNFNVNKLLNLYSNTPYVLVIVFQPDACGSPWYNSISENFNISIAILEKYCAYTCDDWKVYNSTHYYRTCWDLYGNYSVCPTYYEYKPITIVEVQNYTLGFEESYSQNVYVCEPQWLFGCNYQIATRTVQRPVGWTVGELPDVPQYFLEMSNEWSAEGTRSLKMWYLPPMEGEPITNTSCGNRTLGYYPIVSKGINSSFFVARNITFPASNMIIRFTVKKCNQTVLKHGDLTTIFGIVLCPKRCYGNCSAKPKGTFYFDVYDPNRSISLITGASGIFSGYYGESTLAPNTFKFDLSNSGIVANRTYTVIFGVNVNNPYDTSPYCVYFDDVTYAVLREPITCESRCIGLTWYEAQIINNTCIVKEYPLHPNCVIESIRTKVENCEAFCVDTTKWIPTDECTPENPSYDTIENHPDCVEETEVISKEQQLITPLVNVTQFESAGLGFITPFFTPIVLFFLLIGGIGSYVAMKTGSWQIGVAVMIGLVIVFSTSGLLPSWFAITFIIIAGLILGKTVVQMIKGG